MLEHTKRICKIHIIGVLEGGEKDTDQRFSKTDKRYHVKDLIRSMNSTKKYTKKYTNKYTAQQRNIPYLGTKNKEI